MSNKDKPDKPQRLRALPLDSIHKLRFVDESGRVFALDNGRVRGEYILREKQDEAIRRDS